MIRLASALILVGLVPVVQVLLETTGPTATRFTFVGVPCLAAGIVLYVVARLRSSAQ